MVPGNTNSKSEGIDKIDLIQATLQITEIFFSIQGESSYMGLPCIFIRTTGCDLRCAWCDTEYAFYGGQKWSIQQILDYIQQWECALVELTGGEPLLQKHLPLLAEELLTRGYTVLVETGGHRDISGLNPRVVKILDLKCPGSGEAEKNYWPNLQYLEAKDEVKFVIKDRLDYDWAVEMVRKHQLEKSAKVLFSPVFGKMNNRELAEWILEDRVKVRLQLQMHKSIWDPETHGV